MKQWKLIAVCLMLTVIGLPVWGQMQFNFSNLSGVVEKRLTDGTTLVQLPAGTDLTKMSAYGMTAIVDGVSVPLNDIVPNPASQSYADGVLNSFYYQGRSYQVRFSSGEYFTAVLFTDASVGAVSSKVSINDLQAYANRIVKMGQEGGRRFTFDALPGYNATADIAFYLGDMTSTNSATPIIHTLTDYKNVTKRCAVVFGQFETMGNNSTITEYGLCYGSNANPTLNDSHKAASDIAGEDDVFGSDLAGIFGVYFDGLEATTTYHYRAYCTYTMNGTSYTIYGEDRTFATTAGSGFTWAWEGGETPSSEVKARIEEAMNGAKEYYTDYCNLYKWCGTSYHSGVATADCSLRSDQSCYIRFGPNERYQWVGTAQHEISHGYGVGQTSEWAGYPKPLNFPTATLTLRVFLQDMTMLITHDDMHYWPGGINQREEVTNGTANNKGTYTCKNEEMLKCNALILNGMALDGMKTTYGVKEQSTSLSDMWDEAEPRQVRRKVSGDNATSFETALNAFNEAGIPLLVSPGEKDLAAAATSSGYSQNQEAYAVATRALAEAQSHGVEDVTIFNSSRLTSNVVQPQPYAFRFKGMRFYNGLYSWADKPITMSGNNYSYQTSQALSNLSSYIGNHATESSIWLQHLPFASDGSSTLGNLIKQTSNAAMFSGHDGTFAENMTSYGFTDRTVPAMTQMPGDALLVLMKAGTGVIEVKQVDFRDYGIIVAQDEPDDDIPTSATFQDNAILGGLVKSLENLSNSDNNLSQSLSTARQAKTESDVASAIEALSAAFASYAGSELTDMSALLGENTDFETPQGDRISTAIGNENEGLFAIPGWTENHLTNQTSWAFCQYKTNQEQPISGNSLYLRENWKGSPSQPSTIQVYKDAVLPAGKFRLSFYLRQPQQNYSELLNYYEVNGQRTNFSAGTGWEAKSFDIEVSKPSVFRLSFGFRGTTSAGNVPCQVDVDQVNLYWIPNEGNESLEGTYYLYNPSSDLFLTASNNWGTQASMGETGIDFELTASGIGYTLNSNISNGENKQYLGTNLFLDSPMASWQFTEQGYADGKKLYSMSADNMNYLCAPESGNVVTTTNDASSERALWQLVTREELIAQMEQAMEDQPMNVTFLLPGYGFSRNDKRNNLWQGGPFIDGANENMNGEKWNTTFDVYQELTDIPNGIYELSAQAYYRDGGYASAAELRQAGNEQINAYLYANNEQLALPSIFDEAGKVGETGVQTSLGYIPNNQTEASAYMNAGLYQTGTLRITVADGTLSVGVRKSESVSDDWTCIDNFRLMYLGDGQTTIGDVNRDGQISIADVTALVNIILGKDNTEPYLYDHKAADVNRDQNVSIADVTALVNIILGKQ